MRRPMPVVVFAACAAALATYALLGIWSRYAADDFCSAGILRERGFWNAQHFWYVNWSGRWAFTLAISALQMLGPRIAQIAPFGLIAIWCFVAIRSLRSVAAIAVVYATISGAADAYQSMLWLTGLVTYGLPVVLLTAWCGAWLDRGEWRPSPGLRPPSPRKRGEGSKAWPLSPLAGRGTGAKRQGEGRHSVQIVIDILLPLLAAGLSETSAICAAIFFALGALFAGKRRPFVIALVSSLVSLAIVAAAPGNAIRHGAAPPHIAPLAAAASAAYADLGAELVRAAPQLLLVFALAALVCPRRANRRAVVFAAILAVACPLACELASYLAVGTRLPDRALIVTHFFSVVAAAIVGAFFDRKPIFAAIAILALVMPIVTIVQNANAIPREREIAKTLDDLDHDLRGGHTVVTAPQSVHGNLLISTDPRSWANQCLCRYYGLNEVRSTARGSSRGPRRTRPMT